MLTSPPPPDYPPDPPALSSSPDPVARQRLLDALAADLAQLATIETFLRPFNLHRWIDSDGSISFVLARPLVIGPFVCDYPNRTHLSGDTLLRCGGAQSLGGGRFNPEHIEDATPVPAPGRIYAAKDVTVDAVSVTAPWESWLLMVNSNIDDPGAPPPPENNDGFLRLQQSIFQAGTEAPPDNTLEVPFPLSSSAPGPVTTESLGALEFRHTPLPYPLPFITGIP